MLTQAQTDLPGYGRTAFERWYHTICSILAYFLMIHLTAKWVGLHSQHDVERQKFTAECGGVRRCPSVCEA